jgi:hypothetical protein
VVNQLLVLFQAKILFYRFCLAGFVSFLFSLLVDDPPFLVWGVISTDAEAASDAASDAAAVAANTARFFLGTLV